MELECSPFTVESSTAVPFVYCQGHQHQHRLDWKHFASPEAPEDQSWVQCLPSKIIEVLQNMTSDRFLRFGKEAEVRDINGSGHAPDITRTLSAPTAM